MIVQEVRALARHWAEEKRHEFTGFHGAFLHGSMNWMPDEMTWPHTSDVDIVFLLEDPDQRPFRLRRFWVQGVIVEHALRCFSEFQTAEQILGTYFFAPHFTVPACILLDPDGHLTTVQSQVAQAYAQRTWVRQRCEGVKQAVAAAIQDMLAPEAVYPPVIYVGMMVVFLGHSLMVANLQNPTWRKALIGARKILEGYGQHDLYTSLLRLMGCAEMDRPTVESLYAEFTTVYDRALAIHTTPLTWDFYVHPKSRQAALEGLKELITAGFYREAIPWMLFMRYHCQVIVDHDASDTEKALFQKHYTEWLHALGLRELADYRARAEQARQMLDHVMAVTETIMVSNPHIVD